MESTVDPDNCVAIVNVLDVAVFDGSLIILVPIVNANFSPAVNVSDAKLEIVTT